VACTGAVPEDEPPDEADVVPDGASAMIAGVHTAAGWLFVSVQIVAVMTLAVPWTP
jgi:hypothetical protein